MVNPKLSLLILQQMFSLGIKKARFQPETFNPEVLDYCKAHGIDYETEKCLLVAPPEHLVDFVNTK